MSATFSARTEAARLRKTIALAEEALREAATLRKGSDLHPDAMLSIEQIRQRWDHAHQIETAALACRKAARAALVRVTGLVVTCPAGAPTDWIEAARTAALALKAAIDRQQEGGAL